MKSPKLPRKRKKAYKKNKSNETYMCAKILAEVLVEDGIKYGDRFYDLEVRMRGDKRFSPFNNEYVVTKRW